MTLPLTTRNYTRVCPETVDWRSLAIAMTREEAALPMEHLSNDNINAKEEEPPYEGLAEENKLTKALYVKM